MLPDGVSRRRRRYFRDRVRLRRILTLLQRRRSKVGDFRRIFIRNFYKSQNFPAGVGEEDIQFVFIENLKIFAGRR